jgi:2-polyprenyl-6-methoxyphenol hydroxylase-like FAD-dependent oxidoreductase
VRIAIIGGGIGGLTAALALRQEGLEPDVFEQAPELLEVGAAIAMWPNATRVLMKLGVGASVLGKAGVIERVRWLDSSGKAINQCRLPIEKVPAVALHRADLQGELLHALPRSSIHLGHTFTKYHQDEAGIRVNFAGGSEIQCDVLIGADGLHSRLREQAFGVNPPVYRGYTVWRGVTKSVPATLPAATAVEVHGPGRRFGIGPVGPGRTGWWASANGRADFEKDSVNEQAKLLRLFDGWCSPVRELIESTPATKILRNAAFDCAATKDWGVGGMTLLGDAVHPTTPNLGQGGCMAIEDAVVLAQSLVSNGVSEKALRAYEEMRYARTAALTKYSRIYGMVGQWESGLATRSRRLAFSAAPEMLMRRLFSLIFDYDPQITQIK